MNRARAILWAQWRSTRNVYWRGGMAWTTAIGAVWYGFGCSLRSPRLVFFPALENFAQVKSSLPWVLLVVFLYWQVVPLLLAATGAQLEMRKLLAYPIPAGQFFAIETMLRVTAGIEMVFILMGLPWEYC